MTDFVPITVAIGEPHEAPKLTFVPASTTHVSSSAMSVPSTTRVSFPMPSEWANESRMLAMFAPFRPRNEDPRAYDKKMKFWQNVIVEYCEHKGEAHFSKRELHLVFGNGERIPHSLDTVLTALQRSKMTRRRSDYEYDPEDTWAGWTVNIVRRPVLWGTLKLRRLTGAQDSKPEELVGWEDLVHVEIMHTYANELLQQVLLKKPGALLEYDIVLQMVRAELHYSEECINLCLLTLHAQQKIGLSYTRVGNERVIELVKIPSPSTGNSRSSSVHISDNDQTMYRLKQSAARIRKQLGQLNDAIREVELEARQLLTEARYFMARAQLRRKYLLKQGHRKRILALRNVNSMLVEMTGENSGRNSFRKAVRDALRLAGIRFGNVDAIIADFQDSELEELLENLLPSETMFSAGEIEEVEDEFNELLAIYIHGNNMSPTYPYIEDNYIYDPSTPPCDFDVRLNQTD